MIDLYQFIILINIVALLYINKFRLGQTLNLYAYFNIYILHYMGLLSDLELNIVTIFNINMFMIIIFFSVFYDDRGYSLY